MLDTTTLQSVADKFTEYCTFTATARVDSAAIGPDRILCLPGDTVRVIRWHCFSGPTVIEITPTGHVPARGGMRTVPFEWVIEMGANPKLRMVMPFAPYTWSEILAMRL